MASFNDLQTGISKDNADCMSIALITASVQSTQLPSGAWVVYNLIVTINDGRIYGPALVATRAPVQQAVKARQDKEIKDVNNRAAPKL